MGLAVGAVAIFPCAAGLCSLHTLEWPKGHQKFILLEHRGHLLKRFGCRETLHHCFSVLARMGPL